VVKDEYLKREWEILLIMSECSKGRVIPAKTISPTIDQVRRAMTLFADNKFDDYDGHMFKTGHYPQMNAGLSAACLNGHLKAPKVVDLGCGTGVLISHIIASLLKDEIVKPSLTVPITIYGVDTTEAVMAICQARVLRRFSKILHNARPGDQLSVYAVDSESKLLRRLNPEDLTKEKQAKLIDKVILYRDIESIGSNGNRVINPQELLSVNFILEDVTTLTQETIAMLKEASTILVSYCFHWFINKPAVARSISNLLSNTGKFISIEEWPLRVTPPNSLSSEEQDFHDNLASAIESATTPIEVPRDLFNLFVQNGLIAIPFIEGEVPLPYLKNSIDGHHDMFFGIFKKEVDKNRSPGSEFYF